MPASPSRKADAGSVPCFTTILLFHDVSRSTKTRITSKVCGFFIIHSVSLRRLKYHDLCSNFVGNYCFSSYCLSELLHYGAAPDQV